MATTQLALAVRITAAIWIIFELFVVGAMPDVNADAVPLVMVATLDAVSSAVVAWH